MFRAPKLVPFRVVQERRSRQRRRTAKSANYRSRAMNSARFRPVPRWHGARLVVSSGRALDELPPAVSRAGCALPDLAPVTSVSASSDEGRSASRILCDGRTIPLPFGTHIIGRDEAASVSTESHTVSRRHARLVLTPEAAILEDLGSKNGTRVNGMIVRGATALADGDEIEAGVLRLVFRTRSYGSTQTVNQESRSRRRPKSEG